MKRALSTMRLSVRHALDLASRLDDVATNDVALSLRLVHLNVPFDERLTLPGINRIRLSVTASAHEDGIPPILRPPYLRRHRESVIDVLRLLDTIEAGMKDGDVAPTVGDLLDTFPVHPSRAAAATAFVEAPGTDEETRDEAAA